MTEGKMSLGIFRHMEQILLDYVEPWKIFGFQETVE